eukprot:TRINITY_DN18543_c0_g1_i1.p1 TRINITY_DN18543_c0_g1~~TRINITY_DN18543_c0_g1_i1.p1  ORF type:complete len:251 (+),score=67.94 TRINITY_DN18543_c0_g1_i1:104-856(+)
MCIRDSSTAAGADGSSSYNDDKKEAATPDEPSAFIGILEVLKVCTGDPVDGFTRGFDLKANPYHKSGIGRALLMIGLQVAASTQNEDFEASLSSKQLMGIKEKVIYKYVGGVLHQVLLGKYRSLFNVSGLAPAVVRELEQEVVMGAARMSAAPLLQARSQGGGCCSAPQCAEGDADVATEGSDDAAGGDFSGVGSSGARTGQPQRQVRKEKEGPSTAAQILAVSYTHLRAHETPEHLVCRLLLEKKKIKT